MAYVLISHDLAVVRQLTEQTLVMRNGVVVERGETGRVLDSPQEPYTRLLRDSVPVARGGGPAGLWWRAAHERPARRQSGGRQIGGLAVRATRLGPPKSQLDLSSWSSLSAKFCGSEPQPPWAPGSKDTLMPTRSASACGAAGRLLAGRLAGGADELRRDLRQRAEVGLIAGDRLEFVGDEQVEVAHHPLRQLGRSHRLRVGVLHLLAVLRPALFDQHGEPAHGREDTLAAERGVDLVKRSLEPSDIRQELDQRWFVGDDAADALRMTNKKVDPDRPTTAVAIHVRLLVSRAASNAAAIGVNIHGDVLGHPVERAARVTLGS